MFHGREENVSRVTASSRGVCIFFINFYKEHGNYYIKSVVKLLYPCIINFSHEVCVVIMTFYTCTFYINISYLLLLGDVS